MAIEKFVPDSFMLSSDSYGMYATTYDYKHFRTQSSGKNFMGIVPNRIFTKFYIVNYDTSYEVMRVFVPELGVVVTARDYKNLIAVSSCDNGVFSGEFTLVRDGKGLYLISIHQGEFNEYITVEHNHYNIGDKVRLANGLTGVFIGSCHRIISNGVAGDMKPLISKKVYLYQSTDSSYCTELSVKQKCREVIQSNRFTPTECADYMKRKIETSNAGSYRTVLHHKPFRSEDVRCVMEPATATSYGTRGFIHENYLYTFYSYKELHRVEITHRDGNVIQLDTTHTTRMSYQYGSNENQQVTLPYRVNGKTIADKGEPVLHMARVYIVGDNDE